MPNLKDILKKKNDLNIFKPAENLAFIKKMRSQYTYFRANPNEKSHIKFFAVHRDVKDEPIICGSKEEMYDVMKNSIKRRMGGYNFCLGMLSDEGQYQVWVRSSQPCQGGEMRKYGCTHDDCTRPDDPRPTDLSYPFPDGKPLAVGTNCGISKSNAIFLNDDSVFARAFGNRKNISFVNEAGFIVKDADQCDPTVFVNLVHELRKGGNEAHLKMLEDFSFPEMMLLSRYNISPSMKILHKQTEGSNNEYNTQFVNLKNYLKGGVEATQDITGGTLGNRYDYNRPYLVNIFKGGKEVNPHSVFNKIFFGGNSKSTINIDYKEVVDMRKEIRQALKEAA